jgi:hypothetical protein
MLMQRNSTYSIKIAKIEVDHRPTQIPMISLVLFEYGAKDKAFKKYVRKSPKVQYHLAMIYKSNNEDKKSSTYKRRIALVFMN